MEGDPGPFLMPLRASGPDGRTADAPPLPELTQEATIWIRPARAAAPVPVMGYRSRESGLKTVKTNPRGRFLPLAQAQGRLAVCVGRARLLPRPALTDYAAALSSSRGSARLRLASGISWASASLRS